MKHTPTPWRVRKWNNATVKDGFETVLTDCRGSGMFTANTKGQDAKTEANVAFAIKAVNCHDELVEALKEAKRILMLYREP
jgi:hypothetical protein